MRRIFVIVVPWRMTTAISALLQQSAIAARHECTSPFHRVAHARFHGAVRRGPLVGDQAFAVQGNGDVPARQAGEIAVERDQGVFEMRGPGRRLVTRGDIAFVRPELAQTLIGKHLPVPGTETAQMTMKDNVVLQDVLACADELDGASFMVEEHVLRAVFGD